ncbi:hypothetical protein CRG98_038860 [Punica granatum]|uniref:Uncharacterized protein n=1 Tax=Punica granatum TaxID=22663 RepID=A0A2I0I9T3_PUNGR|nr:hypothetical protein CRG98_038860 [Punica granatum]
MARASATAAQTGLLAASMVMPIIGHWRPLLRGGGRRWEPPPPSSLLFLLIRLHEVAEQPSAKKKRKGEGGWSHPPAPTATIPSDMFTGSTRGYRRPHLGSGGRRPNHHRRISPTLSRVNII